MMEWKEVALGDVCKISSSKRIFANEYKNNGIPFYRGKEIIEKHYDKMISNELFISEERYNEIKEKFGVPQSGDLLLTSVGTLGVPYIVRDEKFYFKDGNLTWFTSFNGIDSSYLYYWFVSPYGKAQIDSMAIGSTQKALTITTLSKFTICIPSLSDQRRIASILSSLDKKIETNNKINANLEEMAQAIFKNWFVDFAPFKDGKFVESELGMIPEGWRVGTLSEVIDIKYGKDHKKLEEGEIPVYGSGGLMRKVSKSLYNGESVLIPRKGTLNNILYVNEEFWTVDTMFYTLPKIQSSMKYVYQYIRRFDFTKMNEGTSIPSTTTATLNGLQVLLPSILVLEKFDELLSPMYSKIRRNNEENAHLASIRDTLLPRLMSGEIEV